MKIIKHITIAIIAIFTLSIGSCTKKGDIAATEAKLPALQLSSLGYQQSSPFTTGTILQLTFGATATNTATGAFDIEVYETTVTGTTAAPITTLTALTQTIHFNKWSGYDASTPATYSTTNVVGTAGTISSTAVPTTYSNTSVYQGQVLIRLNKLTSNKTYSVKAYAYSSDGKIVSSITQLSFFKTI